MEPQRIEVSELRHRLDAGERITVLDCRAPEAWQKAGSQIPGSIRVPPDEVDQHLQEIPRNTPVVTYCT